MSTAKCAGKPVDTDAPVGIDVPVGPSLVGIDALVSAGEPVGADARSTLMGRWALIRRSVSIR